MFNNTLSNLVSFTWSTLKLTPPYSFTYISILLHMLIMPLNFKKSKFQYEDVICLLLDNTLMNDVKRVSKQFFVAFHFINNWTSCLI